MNKSNRDEALDALEHNDEELVIEILRGDDDKSVDDEHEGPDKNSQVTAKLKNFGMESIPSNALKLYRKHFKGRFLRSVGVIALIVAVVLIVSNIIQNRSFGVTFYQVRSEKVSDNIRIIELADLHNKKYGRNNSDLIKKIASLHPDLIFYAGDMMNYKNDDYSVMFNLSDELAKIAPIYACYGNNELDQQLFKDKTFVKKLEKHNVELLSNEAIDITVGKTSIQLIAISDGLEQFDVKTNNAKRFIEKLEPTNDCRICLTHYPELFLNRLLHRGIDVAFTGHAHGGAIRLPKIGGLYSTGEGFFPKFTSGVYEVDDGTQVVVSRGLGSHGILPRINNQPELVVVDLCWY